MSRHTQTDLDPEVAPPLVCHLKIEEENAGSEGQLNGVSCVAKKDLVYRSREEINLTIRSQIAVSTVFIREGLRRSVTREGCD